MRFDLFCFVGKVCVLNWLFALCDCLFHSFVCFDCFAGFVATFMVGFGLFCG